MKLIYFFAFLLFVGSLNANAQITTDTSHRHLTPVQRRAMRQQKAISRQKLAIAVHSQVIEEKKASGRYIDELNTHEISLGYGLPSSITLFDLATSTEKGKLTGRDSKGVPYLSYKYYLLRNVAVGLLACYETGGGAINGYSSYTNAGKYTYTSLSLASQLTVLLKGRKNALMYCSVAIGYSSTGRKLNYYN
ncbi:MAG: hypothetical protein JSS82_05170 [Bacteroidetes bacterium]|nr:hypothetical protein [Bacteroidota bacterium]